MSYERYGNSKFHVGDYVRVVDEPYDDCPFTWIDEMDIFCGREVLITGVGWSNNYNTYYYEIEDCDCEWCANCFYEIADTIPEQTELGFLEDFGELFS